MCQGLPTGSGGVYVHHNCSEQKVMGEGMMAIMCINKFKKVLVEKTHTLVKYKCNLNTTILILMVFWASFHLLHFCLLNWSLKITIKKPKKPSNPSPSPEVVLPRLSENLAVCIRIPQCTMKQEEHCFFSGGAPCLHCLNAFPQITFWLLVSDSFINRTYFRLSYVWLIMHSIMCLIEILWVYKKIPWDRKLWMTLTAPRGACSPPGVSGTKPA